MDIEATFIALLFIVLGGFYLLGPDLVIKFQIWSQQKIMGVKYAPSERTYKVVRVVGFVILVIGLIALSGMLNLG